MENIEKNLDEMKMPDNESHREGDSINERTSENTNENLAPDTNSNEVQPEKKIQNEIDASTELNATNSDESNKESVHENGWQKIPESDESEESEIHEEHEEHEESEDHHFDEEPDFTGMSREELLQYAQTAAENPRGKNIGRRVQQAKSEFNRLSREQNEEALVNWKAEGNEETDFKPAPDSLTDQFNAAFKAYKKNRQQYINELNQQKEDNLTRKKELIEKLKNLTESDETGESFEAFKKLQQEWRSIGHVPMADAENLWNSYNFYVDRFYEHRSLYSEFKELDRKRNLSAKEDVVSKIEGLVNAEDLNEALKQLKQLQEEWRHIGPVPREQVEGVIQRYKDAVIKLYERKELQSAELQQKREQNLQAKLEILEKIEEIGNFRTVKVQEWIDKNKEFGEWIEKWRTIGSVPINQMQNLKDRFTSAVRSFNKNKNDFFRERKREKVENLKKKNSLCERVEEIQKDENPARFRKEVIKLQEEWKKSGPVPQKYSDKIWKRFQIACDAIFSKINQEGNKRHIEEKENLEKKNEIIGRLESLLNEETIADPQNIIREIQEEWNKIGHVPFKEKDTVRKRYSDALNKLIKKSRANLPEGYEGPETNYVLQLETWAQEPGGSRRLDQEIQRHTRDLRRLENEVATLENNMEFLSRSKTADKLKGNIEKQISRLRERMTEIEEKIRTVRQVKA